MKIRSFKLKLILSYAFVILFSFGLVNFFLDQKLENNFLRNIETSLIKQAYLVASNITSDSIRRNDATRLEPLAVSLSRKINCRITIINASGRVLADSGRTPDEIPNMESHLYRPEVETALASKVGADTRYSSTLKMDMLYVALPLKEKSEVLGVVRLALPLESVNKDLAQVRRIVLAGLLLALALAFVLGSVIAARSIGAVNRMIEVSRRYSEGDFSHRIIRASRDEIGELAETINRMAQAIETKIKEVREKNQKFSAVLNSMIEGVVVVDGSGHIVSINPAAERIFEVLDKEIRGKVFLEAIRNSDMAEVISACLKSGEPVAAEMALVYPLRRIFEVNATPIFDKDAIEGCLVVVHDITEIRRLETVRSDFVANVSHELKTPLTSIKGFVETLLEGALEDRDNNRKFLGIIQDHAERLNGLVDDLLSLSHLESKEIALKKEPFGLKELAERVISGFSSQLAKKGLTARNEIEGGIMLNADRNRLEQVLTNLIDNAIKFNKDNGRIRVYAEDFQNNVKVLVEDSGSGIPAKDIPRIFERFYRVDKARSRELGGTGLGLSIVKHIVELHGGSVGVESIEGMGSTFWFSLPR